MSVRYIYEDMSKCHDIDFAFRQQLKSLCELVPNNASIDVSFKDSAVGCCVQIKVASVEMYFNEIFECEDPHMALNCLIDKLMQAIYELWDAKYNYARFNNDVA